MNKAALRIIVLLAFTLSYNLPVLAVKTNVNEVNDLFDRHIENKSELSKTFNSKCKDNYFFNIQCTLRWNAL